jgi:hypothetical protein
LQKVCYGLKTLLIEYIQSERNNSAENSLASGFLLISSSKILQNSYSENFLKGKKDLK